MQDSSSDSSELSVVNFAQFLEEEEPNETNQPNGEVDHLVAAFKVKDEEEEKIKNRSNSFEVDPAQATAIAWRIILKGEAAGDLEMRSQYFRFPNQGVFEQSLEAAYGLTHNNKSGLTLKSLEFLAAFNSALDTLWNMNSPLEDTQVAKVLYVLGEGMVACFQNQKRPQASLMTSDRKIWEYFIEDASEQAVLMSTGKHFCLNTVSCADIHTLISKITGLAAQEQFHLELVTNYAFKEGKRVELKSERNKEGEISLAGPLFGQVLKEIDEKKRENEDSLELEIDWVEESRWLGLTHLSTDEMKLNEKFLNSNY